jgi:dTDP-4-dehydrorhamnose 3,5-epimerase
MINVSQTSLSGVLIIEPEVISDERGFFMETFNARDFSDAGLPTSFVQDNHSRSVRGVLRGLHYQYPHWQGKIARVLAGEVFDIAVDIRRTSSDFGQWVGVNLTSENHKQLYIPPGFAHGFCVLSAVAEMAYKCTGLYKLSEEAGVLWNDPEIGIKWPIDDPLLSPKDARAPLLLELPYLTV